MTDNKSMEQESQFPLVDAMLVTPEEGEEGRAAVCTNTNAPGQVLNEVNQEQRHEVSVLGSLIVSRDGAERMVLNSLVHPSLKHIILFSEESDTFAPSTNLLEALQYGLDSDSDDNRIKNSVGASPAYPNLTPDLLDQFREEITVLPAFMSKHPRSEKRIASYIDWLEGKTDSRLADKVRQINNSKKGKVYYDALNSLIETIQNVPDEPKHAIHLNPKDFQHLQPPKVELEPTNETPETPFNVSAHNGRLRVDFELDGQQLFLEGDDEFQLGYSLMHYLGERKDQFTPLQQLALGAEMGRITTQIQNDIEDTEPIADTPPVAGDERIELQSVVNPKMDQEYYYRVGVKDDQLAVACMAFDQCEEVFELQSDSPQAILHRLAELDRFQSYEMDILHRLDTGAQISRAAVAAERGYQFIQDFDLIFDTNTTDLPLVTAEGDTFLSGHQAAIREIYTKGFTGEHPDVQKGIARTAILLATFRDSGNSLSRMPKIYSQGGQTTDAMRKAYKDQLLRTDNDGSYNYGERTRSFFGFDQLKNTPEQLRYNPERAAIIQRFDPSEDMNLEVDSDSGELQSSHDPCLTHDIYFMKDSRLHGFHIARAHNVINAYPENIYGLHDAYTQDIAEQLGVELGDEFMLSSRANILLLTEEQRTKTLLAEPSKPMGGEVDRSTGPHETGADIVTPEENGGVTYFHGLIERTDQEPQSDIIHRLRDINGIDTIERAIQYLEKKGVSHNNPILSEYRAGGSHPQDECLVFYQANVFGEQLHATAVFANRSINNLPRDSEVVDYLATLYAKRLGVELGKESVFYIG